MLLMLSNDSLISFLAMFGYARGLLFDFSSKRNGACFRESLALKTARRISSFVASVSSLSHRYYATSRRSLRGSCKARALCKSALFQLWPRLLLVHLYYGDTHPAGAVRRLSQSRSAATEPNWSERLALKIPSRSEPVSRVDGSLRSGLNWV